MMMKNLQLKNELLKILLTASNHTLQAYTVNKRIGVASNTFFNLIFELEKEKYIEVDGLFVRLLDKGIKYILLLIDHEKKNKSKIPKTFLSEKKILPSDFYIPKRSLL
ncbi:hypothetical protein [Pseudomonas sp.]|uniref:hypothetical protein n=1 Tax=Pseudomonas sp. TaxID=306 RepID=UPI002625431D|nr:hypothetical protein [Pseudomonas sp.]